MPILKNSKYKPSLFFRNKHFNTAYRYFTTNIRIHFKSERIKTADHDFIDLDISSVQSHKAILAIHGLEGSSHSSYMLSLTQLANKHNYDIIAMNLRGCSGVPNLQLTSYHSGKTTDVMEVIQYIEQNFNYKELHIVGYSLGGNLTLKLMGESAKELPKFVKSATAISTPCDLYGGAKKIDEFSNRLYQKGFLKTLKSKVKHKFKKNPSSKINLSKVLHAKSIIEFDDSFTAPLNGFKDAIDYYKKSSSKQFLRNISKPSLLITALDDPFLSASCFPFEEAKNSKYFHLLTPKHGGHVGFYSGFNGNNYWLEQEILGFIGSKF